MDVPPLSQILATCLPILGCRFDSCFSLRPPARKKSEGASLTSVKGLHCLEFGQVAARPGLLAMAEPRRKGGRQNKARERTMRTSHRIAACIGIGVLSLIGVGQPASAQIKIGAVLSVTGPASFLGDPEKKTLEMYVDALNAKGGVNGQKLQLIIYDDAGNANSAKTFATRLIEEDKVVAMIGGTSTGATLAMIPVFEDAQVPFISLAGAIQIVEPVRKWVFKTPHTDKMACQKIFADLKARNLTTVGMISGTDAFGKSMRDQCVAVAPQDGIKIAHEET